MSRFKVRIDETWEERKRVNRAIYFSMIVLSETWSNRGILLSPVAVREARSTRANQNGNCSLGRSNTDWIRLHDFWMILL